MKIYAMQNNIYEGAAFLIMVLIFLGFLISATEWYRYKGPGRVWNAVSAFFIPTLVALGLGLLGFLVVKFYEGLIYLLKLLF